MTFNPRPYSNITDSIDEILCHSPAGYIDSSCDHDGVVVDQDFLDSLTGDLAATIQTTLDETIGCGDCVSGYFAIIEYDEILGAYYQWCDSSDNYDTESENTPCDETGYIKRWQGYIEEEQELVCVACSEIIPSCNICTSNVSCTLCTSGTYQTSVIDDQLNTNVVCLYNFCGLTGFGSSCSDFTDEDTDRTECRRVNQYTIATGERSTRNYDTCDSCNPGTYRYGSGVYLWGDTETGQEYLFMINDCEPQLGTVEEDFFIAPTGIEFFNDDLESDMLD